MVDATGATTSLKESQNPTFMTHIPGPTDDMRNEEDEDDDFNELDDDFEDQDEEDGDETSNQLFELVKAEPPTNYNDPYSTLPPKIKLQQILVSCCAAYAHRIERRDFKREFLD